MRAARLLLAAAAAVAGAALVGPAAAERVSDIRNTKHNLSAPSGNAVRTSEGDRGKTQDRVCVFCHTPHAATQGATPLWNRDLSTQSYTLYDSASLDAAALGLNQPGGSSKLCLSCHDGSLAIGQVNVLNGATDVSIAMEGTDAGVMPAGEGGDTGFTRRLGVDLSNDHPVSFDYTDTLASTDGELRAPGGSGGLIDSRTIGYKPVLPLENGQLQCTTCHDPHIRETDPAKGNIKFLRLNRFQDRDPIASFDETQDQICLACHTKAGWPDSAHADQVSADETYEDAAATVREFPLGTKVWQAGCLNCHDTHTVKGARRLLREGTDGPLVGSGVKSGGSSAIEETCYQCHSSTGAVLQGQGMGGFQVPDIASDFNRLYNMPIDLATEVHDIGDSPLSQAGKDFVEQPYLLGKGNLANRHVECTDCHNPHRVMKNTTFTGTGTSDAGTHDHDAGHTNIASGVLRGTWGVEPNYTSDSFGSEPTSFSVKRGDPGASMSTAVTESYVTREYQVCLKCHSNYAYDTPPDLGTSPGGTPFGTNLMERYTNQAMEFQAPTADQGEPGGNHRSWHPVMKPTGRTVGIRGGNDTATASLWLWPWNSSTDIGSQTMYCSDCHGSETSGNTVVPDGNSGTEDGNAWGPHGSNQPFLLKGPWRRSTGAGTPNDLCFKCHDYNKYANPNANKSDTVSGFGDGGNNWHILHAEKIAGDGGVFRCMLCHVAVPHGWKNKALLVNLNDVGPEGGLPAGTEVKKDTRTAYDNPPYYVGAALKVRTWAPSGEWDKDYCGSKRNGRDSMNKDRFGRDWMRDGTEACFNAP